MYKAALGGASGSLANGDIRQVPAGGENFGRQLVHATAPPPRVRQAVPDSIIIHTPGLYAFCYETSQSIGTEASVEGANYITGANVDDAAGGNVLPIQPTSWHRIAQAAAGDEGDVTFIYRGRP